MGSSSKCNSEDAYSQRHASSNSPPRNKPRSFQNEDWADVTDPEERRRIQNRIAQRKFREKTKENKERAERDARNRDHAGNIYRVASPDQVPKEDEDDLSGLPWGSVNLRHVISRGHDNESKRSGGADCLRDDGSQYMGPYSDTFARGSRSASGSGSGSVSYHSHQQQQQPGGGNYSMSGQGGVPAYYDDDASLAYDPDASPTRQSHYPCAQWRGNSFPMNPSLLQQYDFDGAY